MREDLASDRLARIVGRLEMDACRAVAARVIGVESVSLADTPKVVPLSTHHYDNRTMGILHVSGQATSPDGEIPGWSCVIKVIDLDQPARSMNFVDPEHEILVYRRKLFEDDGLPFRPARCYGVDDGPEGTTLLWLEDLTGYQKPPFTIEELAGIAAHMGSWNAHYALLPPRLPFEAQTNTFLLRWNRAPVRRQHARLHELQAHRYVRDAFRDISLETFEEFEFLAERLNSRTAAIPPSLCFGDCNVGNLFAGSGETVAVDWASLALDPLGVDAGCLIGSAIAWGRQGGAVAESERELFYQYADALVRSGLTIDMDDVRRGYLGQYNGYVAFCAAIPALLIDEVFPVPLVEQRFNATADEIPHLVADVIGNLPANVEELRKLGV